MKKISGFIISCCLLASCLPAFSQEADSTYEAEQERIKDSTRVAREIERRKQDSLWVRNGLRVGVDVIKPVLSFINDQPRGGEISLDYEVKRDYYAVLELGWQKRELDEPRYLYSTSGIFGRLGMEYNILKRKQKGQTREIAYAGLRYGFSSFNLQADEITLSDPYWGDLVTEVPRTSATGHWVEVLVGLKAEIFSDFSMGWSIRAGFLLNRGGLEGRDVIPVMVPGYGQTSKSPVFGFTYSLFYNFW